jgi:hypothetical protein
MIGITDFWPLEFKITNSWNADAFGDRIPDARSQMPDAREGKPVVLSDLS